MSMHSWASDNAGNYHREFIPDPAPVAPHWQLTITFANGTVHTQEVSALYQLGAAILDLTANAAGAHGEIIRIEAV